MGQGFKYTTQDGEVVVGTYDASKNAWTFTRLEEGGGGGSGIVFTDNVYTLNTRPTNVNNPFSLTDDPNTIVNQQEANWYLWESIEEGGNPPTISPSPPTWYSRQTSRRG